MMMITIDVVAAATYIAPLQDNYSEALPAVAVVVDRMRNKKRKNGSSVLVLFFCSYFVLLFVFCFSVPILVF